MKPAVEEIIRTVLAERETARSGELAQRAGMTRQGIHRHLTRALAAGWIVREGRGRGTRYRIAPPEEFRREYLLPNLRKEIVAGMISRWLVEAAPERTSAADEVLVHAVKESVNNAVAHSDSPTVQLAARIRGEVVQVVITDEGIGALEALRERLGLPGHRQALQALTETRTATSPGPHAGVGIFFLSRMVDRFQLTANGTRWTVLPGQDEPTVEDADLPVGTEVRLDIALDTTRSPGTVLPATGS